MARLVGFIGNRPDLGARVIELEADALAVRRRPTTPGWGVGFYQGGEILLKRRPIDDRAEISLADLTRDVRADTLIAHVRSATVGTLRTENTHPFRYRQWLFAHTGTIEAFATLRDRIQESLPQFLQRDVRGETDSELLFHLFLSFLHDAGQLDRNLVRTEDTRAALRSTLSLVDRLCAEIGAPPGEMNVLLSNQEYLVAMCNGAPMACRVIHGRTDIERLFGDEGLGRMRIPDLAACHLSIVASDFDERPPRDWREVERGTLVTFTRTEPPTFERL